MNANHFRTSQSTREKSTICISSIYESDIIHLLCTALQKCGISYSKVGCFVDKRRPFRNMLLDQRKNIDWQNWNDFLGR